MKTSINLRTFNILTFLILFSCNKENLNNGRKINNQNAIRETKPIEIKNNGISNGVWSSNNQFSTPYMQNGIYNTITNIIFNEDGKLTVFEGSGQGNSCECYGNYKLNEDESIIISGIENKNCFWLEMVNGKYQKSHDALDSYTNEKNGIRFDYYKKP